MEERALSGLRVLEFGDLVSVPYCGKLMADLGCPSPVRSRVRSAARMPVLSASAAA